MIKQISAENFKGLSFKQDLGRFNLILGPMGSGKSARSQGLILAINGYIPGGAKKNAEILDSYGTGDSMSVCFVANDTLMQRGFVRSEEGAVSQKYGVNGAKKSEQIFSKSMGEIGNPKVVDVSMFTSSSNQKMIDAVFSLFPPAGDISSLQDRIDTLKEEINTITAKARAKASAAAQLVTSRANITLPPGTAADAAGKITETTSQLKEAREQLQKALVEEATEKGKQEAAKKVNETPPIQERTLPTTFPHASASDIPCPSAVPGPIIETTITERKMFSGSQVRKSIENILNALVSAGCESCAAKLVAKSELMKYREVN